MIGLREDGAPVPHGGAWLPLVARVFAEDGWLAGRLALEHRPEQERMARGVADAFLADEALLFEAGTGVGKSLAYLVPGLLHAMDDRRPMVVSTHTIALQEQILQQDLALCRRLFAAVPELEPYAAFRAALLVGKTNYLCTTRLAQALEAKQELFPGPQQAELQRIAEWARGSADGLRQELSPAPDPEVWEWVHADSSACNRRHCHPDRCFYRRARARIEQAHLVVVNHSLLFAHVAAGGAAEKGAPRGVLLPDDFLVLDEAHTVPDVATEHFGLRVSSHGVDRFLKGLFHPARNRGLLQRIGSPHERQLVADCLDSATLFFGFVRERLLVQQPVVRIRMEDQCPEFDGEPFRVLHQLLGNLADKLDDGPVRDELTDQRARLGTYHDGIRQFLRLAADDHVHWVERSGKQGQVVTLRSAPVDVAPELRRTVFERQTAVVLTSATLATGGETAPFQQRVGATEARAVVVDSPFDYARHMRVYVAADVPQPTAEGARLALDALADWVGWCATRVAGGSLVLFTSYADMNRVADMVGPALQEAGRPLFVQGREWSRSELTRRFKTARNAVLLGTDSFWTGVDVPGPALSQVILTRLPFDVPSHPVAEARAEWVRERGGHPFNEITLPEALMKFRQGIGRLIRSKTDRGLVTILDARVLHKAYGRLFLASLPNPRYVRVTRADRESLFRPFA